MFVCVTTAKSASAALSNAVAVCVVVVAMSPPEMSK